jgi:lysozyme
MRVSLEGRRMIEGFEGNRLVAYKDSAGVLTISVGHTSAAGAPIVRPGMRITAGESEQIFANDLRKFERGVEQNVKVPLLPCEFDSLVSLAFNIGLGAFKSSTLLRDLNRGDKRRAADRFLDWNRAGGKVVRGLEKRRAVERAHFLMLGRPMAFVAAMDFDDMPHAVDNADWMLRRYANLMEHKMLL